MSLPPNTSQGIANALGYLQHHLHKLTERQNVSENNINTTLAALTTQLQQLIQLVANPPLLPVPNTPPPVCTISSSVSAPCSNGEMNTSQVLLSSRLQWKTSQRPHIFELLLPVTNFIWPYLHRFFIDSHGLNGYGKPLKRPFDRYQSCLEAISNGRDIRQINW